MALDCNCQRVDLWSWLCCKWEFIFLWAERIASLEAKTLNQQGCILGVFLWNVINAHVIFHRVHNDQQKLSMSFGLGVLLKALVFFLMVYQAIYRLVSRPFFTKSLTHIHLNFYHFLFQYIRWKMRLMQYSFFNQSTPLLSTFYQLSFLPGEISILIKLQQFINDQTPAVKTFFKDNQIKILSKAKNLVVCNWISLQLKS